MGNNATSVACQTGRFAVDAPMMADVLIQDEKWLVRLTLDRIGLSWQRTGYRWYSILASRTVSAAADFYQRRGRNRRLFAR